MRIRSLAGVFLAVAALALPASARAQATVNDFGGTGGAQAPFPVSLHLGLDIDGGTAGDTYTVTFYVEPDGTGENATAVGGRVVILNDAGSYLNATWDGQVGGMRPQANACPAAVNGWSVYAIVTGPDNSQIVTGVEWIPRVDH